MLGSVYEGCAASERSEVVPITHEELARVQPQAVVRQRTATLEVVEHRFDPLIDAGNRVITRNVPFDVVGQQRPNGFDVAARVHRVLCGMELVEE